MTRTALSLATMVLIAVLPMHTAAGVAACAPAAVAATPKAAEQRLIRLTASPSLPPATAEAGGPEPPPKAILKV